MNRVLEGLPGSARRKLVKMGQPEWEEPMLATSPSAILCIIWSTGWGEASQSFNIRNLFKRLDKKGDPWKGMMDRAASIEK